MDVSLPDGTVVTDLPDDTTQTELIRRLKAGGHDVVKMGLEGPSGFVPAIKASTQSLLGELALVGGKLGITSEDEAQRRYEARERESARLHTPTKTWSEAPITKFLETLGGSLPYMAAPLAAAGAVAATPITGTAALIGTGLAAGAASATQFTGSNLARTMEAASERGESGSLREASAFNAFVTSIPQAALDVVGFKLTPAIRRLFGSVGRDITEDSARKLLNQSVARTAFDYTKATGIASMGEGLTEAGQQVLERLQAGLNITDDKAREEYLDSFIGGAALGGAFGIPGRYIERQREIAKAENAVLAPGQLPGETLEQTAQRMHQELVAQQPEQPEAKTAPSNFELAQLATQEHGYELLIKERARLEALQKTPETAAAIETIKAYTREMDRREIDKRAEVERPFEVEIQSPDQLAELVRSSPDAWSAVHSLSSYINDLNQANQTPEGDISLEHAKLLRGILYREIDERKFPERGKMILTSQYLKSIGLKKDDPLLDQLTGMDLNNPDEAGVIVKALEAAYSDPSNTFDRSVYLAGVLNQIDDFLQTRPGSGFYAESTITEPSGEGVGVVDTGGGAPAPEGVVAPEPDGVGSIEVDAGQPVSGEAVQPTTLSPGMTEDIGSPGMTEAPTETQVAGLPTVEIPLEQLTLSKDVPQFKLGASSSGVVDPLGGKFERTGVAPIQVWRRLDGRLEIISGRHRFDLAQRSGEKTIPSQIHDEASGFDVKKAATLDAELNIRDGQGRAGDYVNYFKNSGITQETAKSRGLLARKTGRRAYAIAIHGSDELTSAVINNQINEEAAYEIAVAAPNDSRLQAVGIKAIMDGKSISLSVNMIRAVSALATDGVSNLDMFGFDDSAIKEAEDLAKIASQKQREVQTRLNVISWPINNPDIAKAEGIDIKDTAQSKTRIAELTALKNRWGGWPTDSELLGEITAARKFAVETEKDEAASAKAIQELMNRVSALPKKLADMVRGIIKEQHDIPIRQAARKDIAGVEAAISEAEAMVTKPKKKSLKPSKRDDRLFKPIQPPVSEGKFRELERRGKQPEKAAKPKEEPIDTARIEKIAQLENILKRILSKYGLGKVTLNLKEAFEDEGSYARQLITLALNVDNPVRVLRHESIHALKDMGFFTPAQWAVLEKKAKNEWVGHLKSTRHTDTQSRYDAYVDLFTKEANEKGIQDVDKYVETAIIEEAIADAFGVWDHGMAPSGLMSAILRNLKKLLQAIKEAFNLAGIETAEEIFGKIEKGKLQPTLAPSSGVKLSMRWGDTPLSTRMIMGSDPIWAMGELGLNTKGEKKPGGIFLFNDVRGIAGSLNKNTIDLSGAKDRKEVAGKLEATPENILSTAKAVADEVAYQIGTISKTGTGLGWYSTSYPKAVKVLSRIFPELETNKTARAIFSSLLALTSNGEKVAVNAPNAIKLYAQFRAGKRMIAPPTRRGGANKALQKKIDLIQDLYNKYGDKFRDHLMQETTVGEINKLIRDRGDKPPSGYFVTTKMPTAAVYFGPKLGAFFANLEGAEGYLTMDMWWTRSIHRMLGLLIPKATPQSFANWRALTGGNFTRDEILTEIIEYKDRYEDLNYSTELEHLARKKEPSANHKDHPAWLRKAKKEAGAAYEQLALEHKLMKVANTIFKREYEMLDEAPFNASERRFMQSVANKAQQLLANENIELSIADIQAALWYYEKRLYQHLSGRKADDISYDEAIRLWVADNNRPARPSVVFDRGTDIGDGRGRIVQDAERVRGATPRPEEGGGQTEGKASLRGVVVEVAPSPSSVAAEKWREMTPDERVNATREVATKIVSELLNNLGLKGYTYKLSSGKYEGEVNPNVLVYAPDGAPTEELSEVARVLGYAFDQKATVAFDESNTTSDSQAGFVKVVIPDGMSAEDLNNLREHIARKVPQADGDTLRDGALLYGNFSAYNDAVDTVTDEDYHAAIIRAIESFDYDGSIEVLDPVRFHSELIWPDNRDAYLEGTRYGESDTARVQAGGERLWREGRSRLQSLSDEAISLRDRWIDARSFGTSKPSLRDPNFKFWFGKSTIYTEKDGVKEPETWYHGTGRDIDVFKAKQAGAIFITKAPPFAGGFAEYSTAWMLENPEKVLSKKQIAEAKARAIEEIESNENEKTAEDLINRLNGIIPPGKDKDPGEYLANELLRLLPSGPNIIPVFVRAENPFDYQNPAHVQQVGNLLPAARKYQEGSTMHLKDIRRLAEGSWAEIEDSQVQKIIRDLGFDSFYVKEGGVKNLAVYSPNQLKSVFNQGTWSREDDHISRSLRSRWSDERIASLQSKYAYIAKSTDDNDTKAYAAFVRPIDFLNATRTKKDVKRLESEKQPLDRERLADEDQEPYLEIEKVGNEYRIVGHEGRHRMMALRDEGVEEVPVVMVNRPYGRIENAKIVMNPSFEPQFFRGMGSGIKGFSVHEMIPISYSQRDRIKKTFGGEADVKFSLRSLVSNAMTPNVTAIMDRIAPPTYNETLWERILKNFSGDGYTRIRANLIHRYEAMAALDRRVAKFLRQNGGAAQLADQKAESAALFSDLGGGLLSAAFGAKDKFGGAPVYRNGITVIDNQNGTIKGPLLIFKPLMDTKDPEVFRMWQAWMASKRGRRLDAEGREHLLTSDDITAINAMGRTNPQLISIFQGVREDWTKYNDALVKYMKDTGVITAEMATEWTRHGDYFPFYRIAQEDLLGPKAFSSLANVTPPKRLKGGENPLGDFFETVVKNSQAAIQAGIKNIALQRATSQSVMIGETFQIPHWTGEANAYRVLENGKEVYYRTGDTMLIEALKALNAADLPFLGMLAAPANLLRNLVTKDPAFMLANMLRDSMSAYVTSGVKMTPVLSSTKNFVKVLANKSPEARDLYAAGVIGGYDYSKGSETTAKKFKSQLESLSKVKTPFQIAGTPFTSVWKALEKGTEASDAATRTEVYKKVLAETGNEAEAYFQALEVLNFNRRGNSPVMRVLTAAIPFLNARMQGLDLLFRTAIHPLGGTASEQAKQRMKTFWVRGMTLMALSAMYWALTHDDDDYLKQEQETRDNYWLLPSLGVKIPIPFEVGVIFKVIPERIMALTLGDDTNKDFTESMVRQLRSTFGVNYPQVILPFIETATNHSFFTGRSIVGKGLEDVAPEYQVGPSTTKVAEMIGRAIGYSPMKLDHLIKGYTGTMGTYAADVIGTIWDVFSDDPPKASKRFEQMPIIRRFALDPEARGSVTAYYTLKDSVDEVVRTSNLLKNTMKHEEYMEYMQKNMPLYVFKDYVNDLEKTMKNFRQMKQKVQSSQMDGDQKRDTLISIGQMERSATQNIQTIKKQIEGMSQ